MAGSGPEEIAQHAIQARWPRYMGGQNASSLNVDFAVPNATLLVGGRVVAREGALAV